MDAKTKLAGLRAWMQENNIHAYLQPVHDEYLNEYPPACARRVEWLTGFNGSAGMVAVTLEKAAFFTDGRYTLQAKAQVPSVFEPYNSENVSTGEWVTKQLHTGQRVGYDARLFTKGMVKRLEMALKKQVLLLTPVANPIDALWNDRPSAPDSKIVVHELKYTGKSSAEKRKAIAKAVEAAGADSAVIASPDSLCWLLNIRADDVEGSPLLLAPAILDKTGEVWLFVDSARCNAQVSAHLGKDVRLCAPETLADALKEKGREGQRVLCDPATTPVWYSQMLADSGAKIVEAPDPCILPKAMKNKVELAGIRKAHLRDGVAIAKLLCWLEQETARGKISELMVGEKLFELRSESKLFHGISFNTIAGSGPNGAIVHYRATEKTNRMLKKGELFLLDSGGQYPDGTTDITRTVAIGKPTAEHKDRFTRVLKGHIALAMAKFPEGTSGSALDSLARQYLWEAGLDYDHGTGHGVGHFLNVHEGPQRIGKRGGDASLAPGMLISNEPGYYKTGKYGIRIENLVIVTPAEKGENRNFLGFETVTCAPIDIRLVNAKMLTPAEKRWLNQYHQWVYKNLAPKMNARENAWLKKTCKAI